MTTIFVGLKLLAFIVYLAIGGMAWSGLSALWKSYFNDKFN